MELEADHAAMDEAAAAADCGGRGRGANVPDADDKSGAEIKDGVETIFFQQFSWQTR
jgi:hypothetical protein